MKKIALASILFLIFVCGRCFSQNYAPELLQYDIQYIAPAGWSASTDIDAKKAIIFFHPQRIAQIIITVPEPVSYVAFQALLVLHRNNFKPTREEKIFFCGETCYVFDSQAVSAKGTSFRVKDYKFLKQGRIYSISFVAPTEYFDKVLPEFEKALGSFNIRI